MEHTLGPELLLLVFLQIDSLPLSTQLHLLPRSDNPKLSLSSSALFLLSTCSGYNAMAVRV